MCVWECVCVSAYVCWCTPESDVVFVPANRNPALVVELERRVVFGCTSILINKGKDLHQAEEHSQGKCAKPREQTEQSMDMKNTAKEAIMDNTKQPQGKSEQQASENEMQLVANGTNSNQTSQSSRTQSKKEVMEISDNKTNSNHTQTPQQQSQTQQKTNKPPQNTTNTTRDNTTGTYPEVDIVVSEGSLWW